MSDTTITELYRSLERTIHERLDVAREAPSTARAGMFTGLEAVIRERLSVIDTLLSAPVGLPQSDLDQRFRRLEEQAAADRSQLQTIIARFTAERAATNAQIESLRRELTANTSLIPPHPLEGLQVIPKREVTLAPVPEPISVADRLLMNKDALKALEVEEIVEVEEEEQEEEEQELNLEEFEYKGATYYRDPDNNVYMTDEDGELVDEAIGTWNEAKQRIVIKKND